MAKKETKAKDTKKKPAKTANISGATDSDENIPMNEDSLKAAQRLPVMIHAQYVKDISFENPNAPFALMPGQGRPEMDINFSMDARKLEIDNSQNDENLDNLYEVLLGVSIKAQKGGKTAFIAEIEYGMSVTLNNLPEEKHHPLLLIEMPKYMFPYVRQLVGELTGQGGYPPLMLTPVNFSKFYMDRFGKDIKKSDTDLDAANG